MCLIHIGIQIEFFWIECIFAIFPWCSYLPSNTCIWVKFRKWQNQNAPSYRCTSTYVFIDFLILSVYKYHSLHILTFLVKTGTCFLQLAQSSAVLESFLLVYKSQGWKVKIVLQKCTESAMVEFTSNWKVDFQFVI